ncbi:MAG TPA: rhomboid family intramembrane serine protease [Verrucomicrobia bacterium]|nr:rhomboid family intramembrane serine protease [Verrucomicrobiota bacterium]
MKQRALWVGNVEFAFYTLALLWVVYLINTIVPIVDFRQYGIRPREVHGLLGIPLCPFLHGNMAHILANSAALFWLLILALSFSRRLTCFALLIIVILGGGTVWLVGDSSTLVIGASGVIFGLIGFLLAIGPVRGEWRAAALSILVFVFYGGALIAMVKHTPGTSWLGHASGFVAGIVAAYWTRRLA